VAIVAIVEKCIISHVLNTMGVKVCPLESLCFLTTSSSDQHPLERLLWLV
jgi:hypothetical protein